ncbi:MAG: response regulator [Marinilabiliaceae bacterium]|nr:response regulator [Marinilabiliaceae bacterium]
MQFIKAILFILFLFTCYYLNARNIIFKKLSQEQGLPGVSVQEIFQDNRGIMWLGVEAIGACIYDGKSFTTLSYIDNDSTSLSNNFVIDIIQDKNDNIWLATINGLNRFNRQTHSFTRYLHSETNPNTIAHNHTNCIINDNYENIWVGTENGISIIDQTNNQIYNILHDPNNYSNQQENITILYLTHDKDKNIWVGTSHHGLMCFTDREIQAFLINMRSKNNNNQIRINQLTPHTTFQHNPNDTNSIMNNQVWSIVADNYNNLWIGLWNGIQYYNQQKKTFTRFNFKPSDSNLNESTTIRHLHIDKNQNLWAGTTNDGLIIINTNTNEYQYLSTTKDPNCSLKSNSVRGIFEDKSGMIWIGTKFEGIHLYDRRQEEFTHISSSIIPGKGLNDAFVMSFAQTNNENIFIGTKNKGINIYNNNTKKYKVIHYNHKTTNGSLLSNRIQSLLYNHGNYLWIGTDRNFEKLNLKTHDITPVLNGSIFHTCFDKSGMIWIGTNRGIRIFNPKENKQITNFSRFDRILFNEDISINKLYCDNENNIWIGSRNAGIFKYNIPNDSLTIYTNDPNNSNSISSDLIRSFEQDKNGNIWVGTKAGGLNKYDKKKDSFIRISKLSGKTIYSILEDNFGNLWMGTHNGIVKYNEKEDKIEEYNTDYGIQGKVFEVNAFLKLNNGYIFLGGQNGFNSFNPLLVNRLFYKAPIIISKFKIFDKTIEYDICNPQSIILKPNNNYFSFEFALLDYSNPDLNQYSYMLKGIDNEWINCGTRNYISYTNIPPGNYKFYVKGVNIDGVWSSDNMYVDLIILKPWWMNNWVRGTIIISLLALFFLIYSFRIKSIKQNEIRLKKQVQEKTKALSNAYEELSAKSEQVVSQNIELQKHRDNLEILIKDRTYDLEKAKEKAEESDRLKSAFLANMSHEIRTPLNAIMGFSSLIANDHFEKNELESINNVIQTNGNSLIQIINDIIDISMIDSKQLEIINKPFNLNKFMQNIFESFERELNYYQNTNLKLILDIDTQNNNIHIISDLGRIKQIFQNLFSNAIKFTKQGFIKLGYYFEKSDSKITFYMEDSGIGIEGKFLKAIFNRFHKLNINNNELYGGTGLGLAISKNLAELLGGEMWAESNINKGTKFFFTIKYIPAIKTVIYSDKPEKIDINTIDWSNKHILIVEDEMSNFLVLKTMLRKTKIQITHVETGIQACDKALSGNYNFNLILMDIKLPEMAGDDATKTIKSKINIPIIAQTAFATQAEINLFSEAGFDDYITKPINAEKLFYCISKYL